MTSAAALELMGRLAAVSSLVQTIEFAAMRPAWADQGGIWRREVLALESPLALGQTGFAVVLIVRGLASVALLAMPREAAALWLVFASAWLIAMRWRGVFNGGSDAMTLIVLAALSVAAVAPGAERYCLGYVAIQVCASYLIAGFIKLRARNWRSGRALEGFLRSSPYGRPNWVRAFTLLSWIVILFECTFPFALTGRLACAAFVSAALGFQLGNVYFFGLNRFFWAWLAAYPAMLWWANVSGI